MDMEMRCGLIALVGAPNAGKSTLINALVGEKVGIVSAKPNTTRITVRGVVTHGANQLIFMDTPGLNRSAKAFDRRLVQQGQGAGSEADILVILREIRGSKAAKSGKKRQSPAESFGLEREMAEQGVARKQKVVVVLTKIDRLADKSALLPIMTELQAWGVDAVVPVSAVNGATKASGVARLLDVLEKMLPEGPWLFPPEQVTDMPLPLRLAELTREQAMRLLHQEIPYGVGVLTESIEEVEEGLTLVRQQLLVAKEQHKPMVLGNKGQMLKEIGTKARKEMQKVLGTGVRLELHVKVANRWLEREAWLREMGL